MSLYIFNCMLATGKISEYCFDEQVFSWEGGE